MASITDIENKVIALAVRVAAEIDEVRASLAAAGLGGSVDWSVLVNVPATFTPAAHTHTASAITDFAAAVDARIALVPPGTPAWGDITGKPTEFPPEDHSHVTGDVTGLEAYVDGRIALAGSGTGNVFGPATTVVGNLALWDNTGGTLLADAGGGISATGLSFVALANHAAMRAALELEVGVDVAPHSAKLDALIGLSWAADKLPYITGASTMAVTDISAFGRTIIDDADAAAVRATLGVIEPFPVALSDESTTLVAGTAKRTFRAPYACIHVEPPRLSLKEAHTAGTLQVDANINGTSMLSTKLTIDANEKTSVTAATPAVMSTNAWDNDDEITVDLDSIGSGGTPKGAKIVFYIRRS